MLRDNALLERFLAAKKNVIALVRVDFDAETAVRIAVDALKGTLAEYGAQLLARRIE